MSTVTFFRGQQLPLEMHKVRIIQKLNLLPIEQRRAAIEAAGHNTFLLQNADVFLDMLTDSGVNAMSDQQQAVMLIADDAYAGSATYTRLHAKLVDLFGMDHFLPAHHGRAAEHILAQVLVRPGTFVPMNYHFTTSKAHITHVGAEVLELIPEAGLEVTSSEPFKATSTWTPSPDSSPTRARTPSATSASRRAPTSSAGSRSRWRTTGRPRRCVGSTASSPCWMPPCWPTTCTSSRRARLRAPRCRSQRSPA